MTTLSELKKASAPATVAPEVALAKPGYDSAAAFEGLQRIGKMFASSTLVPAQFRGMQNIGNTCIALEMALRMQASPMMVLQNMYMVQGKPGWSTQFLIACFNQTGRFSPLRYEFEGQPGTDSWGCRASATDLSTGEKITGTLVTMAIAKKEGWYGKSGSKWQTMPEQMLRYRAAAWFIRSVAPEVAMGMYTVDELRDVERAEAAQYVPPVQPVQPEVAPDTAEQEQPKKRGRKSKVQPEQEQIEEAEEIVQTAPAMKSETRRTLEDICANFADYNVDPDAAILYAIARTGLSRADAESWLVENPEEALTGLKDYLRRTLPTWDEYKADKETSLTKAEIAAGFFGVTFAEMIKAPLDKIADPETRQRQLASIMTTPDAFLHYVGAYIRN